MMNKQPRWPAILLIIIGATSYGMLSPLIKIAYRNGWSNPQMTVTQTLVGTLLFMVLLACRPKDWRNPFKGPWVKLALVGIFGLTLTTFLYNMALEHLDASLAIVLLFQFTWITILMDSVTSRKWPRRNQLLAVPAILLGTLLAVNVLEADWSRLSAAGILLGLGAAVAYSVFLFGAGQIRSDQPSLLRTAVMLLAGLPVVLLVYGQAIPKVLTTPELLLWGGALGLFGQVVPTLCFNIGIPRLGSSLSALLGAVELPVVLIGSLAIVGEAVHPLQWLGIVFILGGIVLSEMGGGAKT